VRRVTVVACAALALLPLLTPSASASSLAPEQNYRVDVVNHSGFALDEVALAVARYGDPVVRLISQHHIASGATAGFDLGTCAGVRQFAASAFFGNREVLHTRDIAPSPNCHTQIEITHT
jgi:hypothetical protein